MNKQDKIRNALLLILQEKFGIPKELSQANAAESLNGDVFRFDAINMVYFILELKEAFCVQISDSTLRNCAFWSIEDYAQYLAKEAEKHLICSPTEIGIRFANNVDI